MRATHIVPPELSDRLDRVLARLVPGLSRGAARRLITAGAVFLNGKRCRVASRTVRSGDRLQLEAERAGADEGGATAPVVYQDDELIAIDKPAGMPSAPTRTAAAGTAAEAARRRCRARLWVVHRLDAATSGVLVLARTRRAAALLSGLFRDQRVVKTYRALVATAPGSPAGTVDAPLRSRRGRAVVDPNGLAARTEWRVVGTTAVGTLLELTPRTGRMHQIRAHLASIGSPIVGDPWYGGVPAARLMLHASALELPWRGATLRIEAPPPRELT
jgi:23S rRNA pseudouridine1911/1915/1917 synthase